MKPEEIQKLLGGYATGTLTPEEQQALFAAALDDQELFDSLAKEQALRDLLRDPAARAQVLAAIDDRPQPWWRQSLGWVVTGATLAACLAAGAIYWNRPKPAERPVLTAMTSKMPELPPSVPPVEEPQPAAPAPVAVPAKRKELPTRDSRQFSSAGATVAAPKPKAEDAAALPPAAASEPVKDQMLLTRRAARPMTATGSVAAPAAPPALAAPAPARTAHAEAVEVTAAPSAIPLNSTVSAGLQTASNAPVENARTLFYGGSQFLPSGSGGALGGAMPPQQAPQFKALVGSLAASNLGVKWTALRKDPAGLFDEIDPEQIKAGDTVRLRLVPNDNGYLSIMEGAKAMVAERPVQKLVPFETPDLTGDGKKELLVVLARGSQSTQKANKAAPGRIVRTSDQSEHAVYEVSTGTSFLQPVTVKITLNFQSPQ